MPPPSVSHRGGGFSFTASPLMGEGWGEGVNLT